MVFRIEYLIIRIVLFASNLLSVSEAVDVAVKDLTENYGLLARRDDVKRIVKEGQEVEIMLMAVNHEMAGRRYSAKCMVNRINGCVSSEVRNISAFSL